MALKKERENKGQLIQRMRRIEGQVQAITRMLEADASCTDLLTQVAAARAALLAVGKIILQDHLHSCLREQQDTAAALDEIETILSQFVK